MKYKRWLLVGAVLCHSVWAQDRAPMSEQERQGANDPLALAQRQLEGERLREQRRTLDDNYALENKACYQQFNVTQCRVQARERWLQASAELRRSELAYNASERRLKADQAQQRLQLKQQEAQQRLDQVPASAALASANDKPNPAAIAETNSQQRAAYEQKQRDAQAHRDNLERRLRERDRPAAAPLPLPPGAP